MSLLETLLGAPLTPTLSRRERGLERD